MAIYAYRCRHCGLEHDTQQRADLIDLPHKLPVEMLVGRTLIRDDGQAFDVMEVTEHHVVVDSGRGPVNLSRPGFDYSMVYFTAGALCPGEMRRVWAVALERPMMEHFNTTVGKPISDGKKFVNELNRLSDQYSERSGVESKFVPTDPNDHKALGVTGEGLDSTNRVRRAKGLPEVKV